MGRPRFPPQWPRPRLRPLVASWTYFLLNFVFFGYPWPWQSAVGWFANGLIYFVAILCLTVLAIIPGSGKGREVGES